MPLKYHWQLPKAVPKEIENRFPEIHPIILSILFQKGLTEQREIDEFLFPDYSRDIYDPFMLKDMRKGVERIRKARDKKEKVVIYGDFDADGVTSATVLFKTFRKIGIKSPEVYLPDREKDGFGLNEAAIKRFAKEGVNLIVTCDCGITNYEEVKLAQQKGIDVIVTDHHQEGTKLPPAFSLINPKLKREKYPCKHLAGVGVAFKLCSALLRQEKMSSNEAFEKWLLDLVAVGTVADMMPLLGENRTLVKYGLIVLNKTSNLGLRTLIERMGLALGNISSEDISFRIGPYINAAGRINHANDALLLLLSHSKEEANRFAEKLEEMNNRRQKIIDKVITEIKGRFSQEIRRKIIFVEGNWPEGIVGLVAHRLVEEYGKPAVVVSKTRDLKGSGRASGSFDLFGILAKFRKYFLSFGGHKKAVGFKLKNQECLNLLKEELLREAHQFKEEEFCPKIRIDAVVRLEDINWELYEKIDCFQPFGQDNEMPKFLARNIQLTDMMTVGRNGEHRRLIFENTKKMIYFSVEKDNGLKVGNHYDVVFVLGVNQWNGQQELQLKVVDIREA